MVSEAELNESMTEETATQKKPVPPAPAADQSQILRAELGILQLYLAPRSCPDHDEDNHARRDTGVVYSGIESEA